MAPARGSLQLCARVRACVRVCTRVCVCVRVGFRVWPPSLACSLRPLFYPFHVPYSSHSMYAGCRDGAWTDGRTDRQTDGCRGHLVARLPPPAFRVPQPRFLPLDDVPFRAAPVDFPVSVSDDALPPPPTPSPGTRELSVDF